METSLSNLVDNLTEGIHKIKCKDYVSFLECESVKDNLIRYKCLSYNKNYSNKLDEELKNRIKSTFKFSNDDIDKYICCQENMFILMSICMNGESLMKHHCLNSNCLIAS